MKPSEVLRAAATRLETHGWCQDGYYNGAACCVVGAVSDVLKRDADGCHSVPEVMELAADVGFNVVAWNDAFGRTAEEVIAQLRATAARLEGEGR